MEEFGGKAVAEAFNQAKNADLKYDQGGDLPAGVRGVAKLTHMSFKKIEKGKTNEGKLIFYARGTVVSPKTYKGMPVEGCATTFLEQIFDTPNSPGKKKTWKDHYNEVINMLRVVFNVKVDGISAGDVETKVIPALLRRKPSFIFRTYVIPEQGKKEEDLRVLHKWISPYVQSAESTADETVNRKTETTKDDDTDDNSGYEEEEKVETNTPNTEDSDDIDTGSDEVSTSSENNEDDDTLSDEVKTDSENEEEEEEEEEEIYKIGQNWLYRPKDKKTGELKKPVKVEIIEVHDDNTVTLANVAKPSIRYRKIKVESLKPLA